MSSSSWANSREREGSMAARERLSVTVQWKRGGGGGGGGGVREFFLLDFEA